MSAARLRILSIPACVALLAAPAFLAAEGSGDFTLVQGRGYLWAAQQGGSLSYDSSLGVDGTQLDMDELALDDFEISPMIEGSVQLPLFFDFHAGLWSYGTKGDAILDKTVVFGDQVYTAGTSVSTETEYLDVYGEIAIAPLDNDWVGLDLGLAIHWIEADLSMRDNTTQQTQSVNESVPMPALDVRARVSPPTLTEWVFEGRVHFMDLEIDDSDLRFIDVMVNVNYYPTELVAVSAGYRSIMWDAHYQEVDTVSQDATVDIDLGGPYIGVIVQW